MGVLIKYCGQHSSNREPPYGYIPSALSGARPLGRLLNDFARGFLLVSELPEALPTGEADSGWLKLLLREWLDSIHLGAIIAIQL